MSEPESSRAASWRWLVYGGIVAVTGIALYFVDRPVWDVLHRQIDGWTALCLILWLVVCFGVPMLVTAASR